MSIGISDVKMLTGWFATVNWNWLKYHLF